MHKLLVAFTLTIFGTAIAISAPWQTRESLQQKYVSFLSKKGYFSKIDGDGDVQFQHDGKTYFIEVNEYDTTFFRIVCPNIWSIDSESERAKVLHACDVVNKEGKVTKAYTTNDDVWIGTEVFCATTDDYEVYFDRCLKVLKSGIETFVEEMRE